MVVTMKEEADEAKLSTKEKKHFCEDSDKHMELCRNKLSKFNKPSSPTISVVLNSM